MTKINDGGPAFPFAATDYAYVHLQASGMSVRDWFAGQALATMDVDGPSPKMTAEWAYRVADAMLAARSGGQDDA